MGHPFPEVRRADHGSCGGPTSSGLSFRGRLARSGCSPSPGLRHEVLRPGSDPSSRPEIRRREEFGLRIDMPRLIHVPVQREDAPGEFVLRSVGRVRSSLRSRREAPRQGEEGAPDAWIELEAGVREGLDGIAAGDEIIVLTWLHRARREVLSVRPRDDPANPICGVFATRSPDRPNPIGLHRVRVIEVGPGRLKVGPLEAIDGTPVVDLKPVLPAVDSSDDRRSPSAPPAGAAVRARGPARSPARRGQRRPRVIRGRWCPPCGANSSSRNSRKACTLGRSWRLRG
jgi:tRNA-Thr(GGU) m(6)t(6)A37 methyltransferase TsaA